MPKPKPSEEVIVTRRMNMRVFRRSLHSLTEGNAPVIVTIHGRDAGLFLPAGGSELTRWDHDGHVKKVREMFRLALDGWFLP